MDPTYTDVHDGVTTGRLITITGKTEIPAVYALISDLSRTFDMKRHLIVSLLAELSDRKLIDWTPLEVSAKMLEESIYSAAQSAEAKADVNVFVEETRKLLKPDAPWPGFSAQVGDMVECISEYRMSELGRVGEKFTVAHIDEDGDLWNCKAEDTGEMDSWWLPPGRAQVIKRRSQSDTHHVAGDVGLAQVGTDGGVGRDNEAVSQSEGHGGADARIAADFGVGAFEDPTGWTQPEGHERQGTDAEHPSAQRGAVHGLTLEDDPARNLARSSD